MYEGNRATDVTVVMDPTRVTRPEDLAAIPITGDGGRLVTLSQVADIARDALREALRG